MIHGWYDLKLDSLLTCEDWVYNQHNYLSSNLNYGNNKCLWNHVKVQQRNIMGKNVKWNGNTK